MIRLTEKVRESHIAGSRTTRHPHAQVRRVRTARIYRWVCLFVCDKVSVCNLIDCAHALTLIPSYHPHRERVVGVPDALQGAELFVRISDFPTKSVWRRRAE